MLKPKVFVGSSSEASEAARAFCNALRDVADMIPWWDAPEFQPLLSTLESLYDAADFYDFALIILSPDDKIESRGIKGMSTRDNVLFEFGLFLGTLGRDRVFPFMQAAKTRAKEVKVPSDLHGITIPRFTKVDKHNLIASVNNAADIVRPKISGLGRRPPRIDLLGSFGFDKKNSAFSMTLTAVKLEQYKNKLKGKNLAVAARVEDENDFVDDKKISFSPLRKPPTLAKDLVLIAKSKKLFGKVQDGGYVEGHLLLIPDGLNLNDVKTISEIREKGGDLLASRAAKVK